MCLFFFPLAFYHRKTKQKSFKTTFLLTACKALLPSHRLLIRGTRAPKVLSPWCCPCPSEADENKQTGFPNYNIM